METNHVYAGERFVDTWYLDFEAIKEGEVENWQDTEEIKHEEEINEIH